MFRSLVNFISHKRTFCRGLHQAAMANTAAVAIMKKAEEKSEKGDVKEKEPKKHAKNPANLKRTNIVGALNKRIVNVEIPIPGHTDMLDLHTLPRISKEVPVTILENGVHKIVGEIPTTLAQKESLPDDRVILLMPQDHSSKYREMQLRNRRDTGSKQDVVREISGVEIQCLERFAKFAPTLTDSGNCQCLHSSCTHIRSFGSIQALAFHVSMKHSKRVGPNNNIPCLLCNRQLKTWSSFQQHVNRVHKHVKAEHNQFRSEENDASGKKKTLKGKNVNGSPRTRSLSPDYTGSDLDEREDDEEEVPPALPQQPALESSHKDEVEGDDGQVDDEPPQLIMMTRGRREIKVPKKYRDGEEIITRSASKANESPKDVEKLVKKDVIEEKFDQDKVVVKKEDNSLNDIEDNNFCSDIQFVVRSLVNNTALDETISTSWNAHSRDVSLAPSISVSESGETPADGHKISKNAVTNKKSAPKIEKKSISSKFLTDRSLKKRSNSHDDTSISTQVSAVIVRKAVKNVKVAIASLSKQDDSDSSDTLENIRKEEPVTRPSRNRKRPDWMDKEDYVIESNKKQRRDEDTPVVINDDACTSAADTDVVTENTSLVARGFRPGFVIPRRKKITDSMDQSGKKSESRSSSTGPPTLMATDFVLPESRPTASTPKKNMMLDAFDMSLIACFKDVIQNISGYFVLLF
uniref:C2H2-type domain-containing protein n=1 Tax=Heterorhabditis bacteriophora TaxID=37862 RepID=A0A1I7XC91_HETBA